MKKFAIAILLSAGALINIEAQAADRAVIGAVDGALVGSYFGGAHGAVAGAILGAVVGSSSENYNDRRGQVRYESDYGRYEPAAVYYAPQASYQPYYEPRYEPTYAPQRVVYVDAPVYESYPLVYARYRAPVYSGRYASPRYVSYGTRHHYNDHRGRY
jgi:uncharacterized protein YcfJ